MNVVPLGVLSFWYLVVSYLRVRRREKLHYGNVVSIVTIRSFNTGGSVVTVKIQTV
jgi:hypothetical protein